MPSSSEEIRSKLLSKLGITKQQQQKTTSINDRRTRDIRRMPRYTLPLMYDEDENEEKIREMTRYRRSNSPSPQSVADLSSTTKRKPSKSVSFNEQVVAVPIPMVQEYSYRMRDRLYTDSITMQENIERNLLEFNFEYRDWRSVVLEEEMYRCGISGELIHPIHVGNRYVFGKPSSRQSSEVSALTYWDAPDVI